MDDLMLLTDGSVNTQSHIGYGAYLSIAEHGLSLDALRTRVKVKRFEHTSSTKLELQTLLWALSDIQAQGEKVIVYTDSQNIIGLQWVVSGLHSSEISVKCVGLITVT
jgi:ribonuclease HI